MAWHPLNYSPVKTVKNCKDLNRQRGFTLLEVMVALAILAMASAVLIKTTSQALNQTHRLTEKNIAFMVAENKVAQLQLAHAAVGVGHRDERATMATRDWDVAIDIKATSDIDLFRVDVLVRPQGAKPDNNLASLTAFIGKH
jgi:general secretion pathway protein I